MKSHEARIAEAISSLTTRLETWNVDEPAEKAHQFIRDMLANGWRTTKAGLDLPEPSWLPGDARSGAEACRSQLRAAVMAQTASEEIA